MNTSLTDITSLTYSLHKIKDQYRMPFSATEYSKFKFGDKTIAKKFGYELADGFIKTWLSKEYIDNYRGRQIVVISSPYCFIPTATFAMKDYFIQKLNSYLVDQGLNVVEETKIHRTITYKEDYGELDAYQRLNLISNDGFHIDKGFIQNKVLFFLDDIKITGSHEKMIKKLMHDYQLDNDHFFLYYAELKNKDIHPNIENYLNYFFVKSLLDLDKIIKNENFLLNTRCVKYILNSDPEEFKTFINYQPIKLVSTIYHQAIGNSYHTIPEYKKNLNYIKQLL